MELTSLSEKGTEKFAAKFASTLGGGETVLFSGDLGSGKTVFAKGIIRYFLPGKRVLSPTFTIVRHYLTGHKDIKNIFHADLYRIGINDGILDSIYELCGKSRNLVLVEWAEKIDIEKIKNFRSVAISIPDEDKRKIIINNE